MAFASSLLLASLLSVVAAAPAPAAAASTAARAVRVTPDTLRMTVRSGSRAERILTLTNPGSDGVTWQVADGTAATSATAGQVLTSWPVGVAVGYGIGMESGNVWISDIDVLRNDSFTVDGVPRGEGWPTPWAHEFPGPMDMAYVASRAVMCQVNTGVDNDIYCWNPRTGEIEATIGGDVAWSSVSQRGLAYRPDDDTFYIGGWNQGVIYHIQGLSHPDPGAVINQCTPADPAISGLGWNSTFGLLWVETDSPDHLIRGVNPDTCQTLTTLPAPGGDAFKGGGLDVDPAGNLWVMSAGTVGYGWPQGTAYLVASGVPTVTDAPWLSVAPVAGTVAAGGRQRLTVRVDASGLAPGRYTASVYLFGSGSPTLITVPVRLVVR